MNFGDFQNKPHFVIAIDGVSGSGKSSTAKAIAKSLGIAHLNTGLMYRIVSYFANKKNIDTTETEKLIALIKKLNFSFRYPDQILVQNKIIDFDLHTPQISSIVSKYAAIPQVRKLLVSIQQDIIKQESCVAEGRDISTKVYPQTQFKFFLSASNEIRTQRRLKQLQENSIEANYQETLINIQNRDQEDSNRNCSPLSQDPYSDLIDTTKFKLNEQVELILSRISQKMELIERSMSNSAY